MRCMITQRYPSGSLMRIKHGPDESQQGVMVCCAALQVGGASEMINIKLLSEGNND